ncbi:MAG TPA: ATP-binding protein, partial [Roseiflexaceae bacterium]|nr:ATP-binding protein [Roseiflexaceae bacterium]
RLTATGYRLEQIEGRSFLDFIPQQLHIDMVQRWHKILSGQHQTFETSICTADGSTMHTLLSAALIPEYGEVFAIVKDITAIKHLEAELRHSETLAALGRVVGGVAHELNNPLTAILGLAQLQLLDPLTQPMRDDMERIEQATLRASRVVQHLQMFVRPAVFEQQPLDLATLVNDALLRVTSELASYGADVTLDVPPDLPPVNADSDLLQQALVHVIQNALQAVAQNPPDIPRSLAIYGRATERNVRLTIEDCGPGIPSEHLPQIFEPFFTTRPVGESAGLGLSIAHAIVQKHGGQIGVQSMPGKGAAIAIELPIAGTSARPD